MMSPALSIHITVLHQLLLPHLIIKSNCWTNCQPTFTNSRCHLLP